MKPVLTGRWAETPSSQRREPTAPEIANGFPCGAWDLALFNELGYRDTDAQRELANLITGSGITLSESDPQQVFRAARQLGGESYTAGGTANALTITPAVAYASLTQLSVVPIRVKATATNTSTATLVVGAFAAKPIVRFDGSPLAARDMISGDNLEFRYDVALDSYRLSSPRSSLGRGLLMSYEAGGSFASGTEGAIPWDNEIYDTDNMHSLVSNQSRITIPSGISVVRISTQVTYNPNATGSRKMRVLKNGTIEGNGLPAARVLSAGASDVAIINGAGVDIPVTGGDYLEVLCIQDSGTALVLRNGGNCWCGVSIIR